MNKYFYLKQNNAWKLMLIFSLCCFSFFESKSQTPSGEFATVYFIRDKDLVESATVMTIKINDSLNIKLKNNSYQKILFKPSSMTISLVKLFLLNGVSDTIQLDAGQTYYFKYFRDKDVSSISGYTMYLRQVSDKVALNSISLIDLNAQEQATTTKPTYVNVEKNTFVKEHTLSPDSSYIYFIRPNVFYGSAVPFKMSLSDSFAFLLPNNTSYLHATTASEVDIITHLKNNNIQNGMLHIVLEKGKAYYVLAKYSTENGSGATLIRMELITKEAYLVKVEQGMK